MPGYINRALSRFAHDNNGISEDSPQAWRRPKYGSKIIYADLPDTSPVLDDKTKTYIQAVIGTLLYYGRAIDLTFLCALGDIASQQAKPTRNTYDAVTKLLNYAASHPDAQVQLRASDMVLHIDSDASYLSVPKARLRAAGFMYLNGTPASKSNPNPTHYNGPVHVVCQILRNVMSSAAEAELGALFDNCKDATAIFTALAEMG